MLKPPTVVPIEENERAESGAIETKPAKQNFVKFVKFVMDNHFNDTLDSAEVSIRYPICLRIHLHLTYQVHKLRATSYTFQMVSRNPHKVVCRSKSFNIAGGEGRAWKLAAALKEPGNSCKIEEKSLQPTLKTNGIQSEQENTTTNPKIMIDNSQVVEDSYCMSNERFSPQIPTLTRVKNDYKKEPVRLDCSNLDGRFIQSTFTLKHGPLLRKNSFVRMIVKDSSSKAE